ncbi:MAG TPA: thymidine phosphorylase [Idiomarina baltica]|uniref:Thymidine phosphorylase n=1 Tax=Idiomarina baltica TaxID=190892 RepID=A0A348WPM9_9GAMM|nr:thymidine phosphorylase [Idiomarinaceae bacterium]MEC8924743.1 thymidine phosphorylase [Pseudomonadota bacterium]HAR56491.1 thymidine phosphorylase [Idiomarina baltica]|tara:strand:+ start:4840 stop:6162 length:1323 start_codon:yes stop_codon:yes gene_type:complete
MSLTREIIRVKRDGGELDEASLAAFIKGITDETVSESQIAAMAMAIFLNGMSERETRLLTRYMRDSGDVLNWHSLNLDGPVLDKHSTGGVGDNVSLMLGPIIAACGGYVPMISGRGLGHTGGTLDKFDSIPGYQTHPTNDLFRRAVHDVGVAIIGQTGSLAPADKRFYATRDVTSTVESLPLITASILSKKLAEGLDGLVLDVKAGSGAFMDNEQKARELADTLVRVGSQLGVPTRAVITDMNQPLAPCAGNAIEVKSAIDYLSGNNRPNRLHQVTVALAVEALLAGGLADNSDSAKESVNRVLESGKALEVFEKMVHTLGGPHDLIERMEDYLPQAEVIKPVLAQQNGYITQIHARDLGNAVVSLGGGRLTSTDKLDYSVGISEIAELGAAVEKGQPLAVVHAANESDWQRAANQVIDTIKIDSQKPQLTEVIYASLQE